MKIRFKFGSAAKLNNEKFWFNIFPYCFFAWRRKGFFVIQAGWLFWDIGILILNDNHEINRTNI